MNKLRIDMNEVQVFDKLATIMDYLIIYYQDMKGFDFMPLEDGYDYEGTVASQMLHYDSETKILSHLYLMTNNTIFLSEDIGTEFDRYYLRNSPITKTEYKDHLKEIEEDRNFKPNQIDLSLDY